MSRQTPRRRHLEIAVRTCFFATDIHGHPERYAKLFARLRSERPRALFLGGDLLPHFGGAGGGGGDFLGDVFVAGFERLRDELKADYPKVFLILGNDDGTSAEAVLHRGEKDGLWFYAHNRKLDLDGYPVYGYAYVPPTPFLNKDWEKFDVSAYVPPGCVAPDEGYRRRQAGEPGARFDTIEKDLVRLAGSENLDRALILFHTPPHDTVLDRAGLDGKMIDHVPLDLHVGSIAVKRFIETRQPRVTMHGHIHESVRLTGAWTQQIGTTHLFGGAHDGPQLALIQFDLDDPSNASRRLL